MFVREAMQNLETGDERKYTVVEETPHPYVDGYKLKRLFRIPGAVSLLVVFDRQSVVDKRHALRFYQDVAGTHLIASVTGSHGSFSPMVIENNHFWAWFDAPEGSPHWGFKFTVSAQKLVLSDADAIIKTSFDYAGNPLENHSASAYLTVS